MKILAARPAYQFKTYKIDMFRKQVMIIVSEELEVSDRLESDVVLASTMMISRIR